MAQHPARLKERALSFGGQPRSFTVPADGSDPGPPYGAARVIGQQPVWLSRPCEDNPGRGNLMGMRAGVCGEVAAAGCQGVLGARYGHRQ